MLRRCLLCLPLLWAATVAAAAPPQAGDIRRALTLLNVVGEEYREGVVGGQVVRPIEYDEAKAFLDEAESRLRGAAPATAAATAADFAAARSALAEKAAPPQVRAQLDQLRETITQATGVAEEIFPPAPPSASRGRALFAENCVSCHGERADGRGPDAARLDPKPANFTDPEFLGRETPLDFLHVISAGKGTSAMPAWDDVLTLQDRWDLISYLWTVQPGPARLAEGQGVYLSACAGCHGATADGQGPYAAVLRQPVPPLNTPDSLARRSNDELFAAVAHGVAGTPMPGFAGRLTEDQMRAAVDHVRLASLGADDGTAAVAASEGEVQRFAGLLRLLSEEYQKALPVGGGVEAQELAESEILLDQVRRQTPRVETVLAARDRAAASAFTAELTRIAAAVGARRPAAEVAAAVDRAAQTLDQHFPAAAAAAPAAQHDALDQARDLLARALAAYRDGNPRAVYLVSDAYFLFDPLEKQLALTDAELARRAEGRFAELRGVMGAPGHVAAAQQLVSAIDADLTLAQAALAPRAADAYGLAFQSGLIILREGFEVVLVIGALLAYVTRTGARTMRRPILWGTVAGVVASLLTAWAFVRLFNATGATGEVLEGATMLLASGVLFFVSYWLISKAEAERWQRYIHGKVKSALATGNVMALAGAAFLAVYREGVETVLFYEALIGSAHGDLGAVLGGLAGGAAALAVVYVLYMRLGKRLPMRQFFLVTGGLLYYLAVVFAGKGVAELQGAGWVPTTPVAWAPRIELLGIFPTVETLAVQAILLLCVVYALVVTVRRARHDRAAGVAVGVASHGGAKL